MGVFGGAVDVEAWLGVARNRELHARFFIGESVLQSESELSDRFRFRGEAQEAMRSAFIFSMWSFIMLVSVLAIERLGSTVFAFAFLLLFFGLPMVNVFGRGPVEMKGKGEWGKEKHR